MLCFFFSLSKVNVLYTFIFIVCYVCVLYFKMFFILNSAPVYNFSVCQKLPFYFTSIRFIVIPIALKLGLTNNRKVLPQPNPVLEDAFNNNRNPDDKTVLVSELIMILYEFRNKCKIHDVVKIERKD